MWEELSVQSWRQRPNAAFAEGHKLEVLHGARYRHARGEAGKECKTKLWKGALCGVLPSFFFLLLACLTRVRYW